MEDAKEEEEEKKTDAQTNEQTDRGKKKNAFVTQYPDKRYLFREKMKKKEEEKKNVCHLIQQQQERVCLPPHDRTAENPFVRRVVPFFCSLACRHVQDIVRIFVLKDKEEKRCSIHLSSTLYPYLLVFIRLKNVRLFYPKLVFNGFQPDLRGFSCFLF